MAITLNFIRGQIWPISQCTSNLSRKISKRFFKSTSSWGETGLDDLVMPEEKEYQNFVGRIFTSNFLGGVGHKVAIVQPRMIYGPDALEDDALKLLLDEAKALVESLPNWTVSEIFTVLVRARTTKYPQLFGSGNMEMLSSKIGDSGKYTAVFVNLGSLRPSQYANLYEAMRLPIYDRYTLVLEIFRTYAKTKEAKLQVALAELQYLKVRFGRTHSWDADAKVLESGSVNMLGPSVFTDNHRLMMHAREKALKTQLEKTRIHQRSARTQRQNDNIPVVSVIGYTNAGKTSLIRCLTQDKRLIPEDRLFATLAVSTHHAMLPSKLNIVYADTIGFISDIPTNLVAAFTAMLEEVRYSQQVIHIRDISHPDRIAQKNAVISTLRSLQLPEELFGSMIEVWNKVDLVKNIETIGEPLHDKVIFTSCYTGEGLKDIQKAVDQNLLTQDDMCLARFKVANGGEALRFLYASSAVQEARPTEAGDQLIVTAILKRYVVEQFLKKFGNLLYTERKAS